MPDIELNTETCNRHYSDVVRRMEAERATRRMRVVQWLTSIIRPAV